MQYDESPLAPHETESVPDAASAPAEESYGPDYTEGFEDGVKAAQEQSVLEEEPFEYAPFAGDADGDWIEGYVEPTAEEVAQLEATISNTFDGLTDQLGEFDKEAALGYVVTSTGGHRASPFSWIPPRCRKSVVRAPWALASPVVSLVLTARGTTGTRMTLAPDAVMHGPGAFESLPE
jgi:hypothetical protein